MKLTHSVAWDADADPKSDFLNYFSLVIPTLKWVRYGCDNCFNFKFIEAQDQNKKHHSYKSLLKFFNCSFHYYVLRL